MSEESCKHVFSIVKDESSPYTTYWHECIHCKIRPNCTTKDAYRIQQFEKKLKNFEQVRSLEDELLLLDNRLLLNQLKIMTDYSLELLQIRTLSAPRKEARELKDKIEIAQKYVELYE